MKTILQLLALCSALFAINAQAQWRSTTYNVKGGWNSIYLHGDASHATMDDLFASDPEVLEVWRWNPNPNQVQFTTSPLIPSTGTPEWSVWVRGGGSNTLLSMTGQTAYLVKCSDTAGTSHAFTIVQRPLPPSSTWVRNGANLLGFPSFKNGANYPSFSNYFVTFPAAIAANTKVFKYVGGDLGPGNPIQIFSPNMERVDRNQAYWFESEVVGNFYAPLEVSFSNPGGLEFGRTGSVITARIRNRTSAPVTITLTPASSTAEPSGQTPITDDVPLTRRIFNATTLVWDEAAITGANNTEVIGPQSTVELSFGIDRAAMTGGSGAFYASLLKITDSGNLLDIDIPASASVSSFAGLWAGEALVSGVTSAVANSPGATTPRALPLRLLLHVDDSGTARLLSQVFMGTLADTGNPTGLCTKEAGLKQASKASARRMGAVHLPLDKVVDGAGAVAIGGSIVCTVSVPFNDPTNPFVHQYHPDHDNKDARPDGTNTPLAAGEESYNITRVCNFTFTAVPPEGTSTLGWGSTVIGGTYSEAITGIHKDTINVSGTFVLRRASEIGAITLN